MKDALKHRLPGDEIDVNEDRAKFLAEQGFVRIIEVEEPKPVAKKPAPRKKVVKADGQ